MEREGLNPSEESGKPYDSRLAGLVHFFEEKFPDAIRISAAEERELLAETQLRDEAVQEKSLLEILEAHRIPTGNIELRADGRWFISYRERLREDLPDGYAFKGGAARFYLREAFGLPTDLPRDYDVVRLTEHEPYEGADAVVARRFMPKDFEFGDGVEAIADIDAYFRTRDLTINEVLATKDGIIATQAAILDTVRNILRLTSFERSSYNAEGQAGPKMLAKLLRFYSEALRLYGHTPLILDSGHEQIDAVSISPFWLAVNLDRAFERGNDYACAYVDTLIENKQLPKNVQTPEDAMWYLLDCMSDQFFIFRSAPIESFEEEDDWVDQLQEREDLTISKIRKGIVKR